MHWTHQHIEWHGIWKDDRYSPPQEHIFLVFWLEILSDKGLRPVFVLVTIRFGRMLLFIDQNPKSFASCTEHHPKELVRDPNNSASGKTVNILVHRRMICHPLIPKGNLPGSPPTWVAPWAAIDPPFRSPLLQGPEAAPSAALEPPAR